MLRQTSVIPSEKTTTAFGRFFRYVLQTSRRSAKHAADGLSAIFVVVFIRFQTVQTQIFSFCVDLLHIIIVLFVVEKANEEFVRSESRVI